MHKYKIAIAGTTKNTAQCAKTLLASNNFEIPWVLTPEPKPIGRKKIITPNPLDKFASKNSINAIKIKIKIDEDIKKTINTLEKIDLLLVVDFGYIIPKWLLEHPEIHSLNIHPSALPNWRGSSPGQFSILFADTKSAVTLMLMNSKLDQGDIVYQEPFAVNQSWTQIEYYEHAFDLICKILPKKIIDLVDGKIKPIKQQIESPTITAKSLRKIQGFVDWNVVLKAIKGNNSVNSSDFPNQSDPLAQASEKNKSLAKTLERASKAFSPWPGLWTYVKLNSNTTKLNKNMDNSKKIMKILST